MHPSDIQIFTLPVLYISQENGDFQAIHYDNIHVPAAPMVCGRSLATWP